MTEINKLRCDNCLIEVVLDNDDLQPPGWMHCVGNSKRYDFCPECWQMLVEASNWKPL